MAKLSHKQKETALTCWEVARHNGPVTLVAFGRIACGYETSPEAWKRAAMRFAAWSRENGVDMWLMEGSLAFDKAALLTLAARLRPSLSPESCTKSGVTRYGAARRGEVRRLGDDELLTPKQVALFLNVGLRKVQAWMSPKRKKPPFPVVRLDGRIVRVRVGDLKAFRESKTVGGVA